MKKILFLAANPRGTAPLRLDQELRDIDEGLRRSRQRDAVVLEQRWAVRPRDILQAMLDIDPQIVHFSGHGIGHNRNKTPAEYGSRHNASTSAHQDRSLSPVLEVAQSGLFFEDDSGQAILVDGVALSGLFELFAAQVKCVVLNGCYSEAQAKAIAQHIPYVIGMSSAISDQAAIEFAVGFYKALGAGRTIEFAYKVGCNAIQMIGVPECLTPVLMQKAKSAKAKKPSRPTNSSPQASLAEYPSGSVPLQSSLYIERFPNESHRYQSIEAPGQLLRIMAPHLMGKTSLMSRILNYATQQKYKKVYLSLGDVEQKVLTDLDSFLPWFCERIGGELGLEQPSPTGHSKILGSIATCTEYFEKYVLAQLNKPLVLGVDEVDRIFSRPEIASDFFGMLRNWFEKGRDDATWKQLRMVLAYSTEDYSQFRINQSPFNVGEPLKLKEFTQQQTQELANRYDLNWGFHQVEQLMAMVGGHPYLLRLAMYYIKRQDVTLEQLLREAPTEDGIYSDHLYRYWNSLQKHPRLAEAVKQVMSSPQPIEIERSLADQLRSMGLVQYVQRDNAVLPSCNLYQLYFSR
ncbi:MAG: AAA-like domain-containing protein [Elainella sp. C42_A2020_010]|nr:AAA-like domain-containing protein [Elainella sp. C42_A2020_010]RNJ67691.1 MAG: adenylate cyclase [Leptolyngbya sp. IPPAS B-1204]